MERNRRDGASAPKRIVLLGATGSIGKSCASVILANPRKFQVEAVVGGRDGAALAACARELGAKFAALSDPAGYADLKAGLAGAVLAPQAAVAQAWNPVADGARTPPPGPRPRHPPPPSPPPPTPPRPRPGPAGPTRPRPPARRRRRAGPGRAGPRRRTRACRPAQRRREGLLRQRDRAAAE